MMKGVTKPGGEDEGNLEDMLARKKDLLKKIQPWLVHVPNFEDVLYHNSTKNLNPKSFAFYTR